ncbi:MAG: hypothetical protein J0H57_05095 [Rhodospirillales bacterium]|nr:hypothetical protein [Rhodospirillales bacterium]
MSGGRLVVGVDVGGTYTDLFLFDEATGRARVGKVPSTRGQEAAGFADGIIGLAPLPDISAIVHGTTVGTNALLERKGARAGLITTQGFRDVLEMRRRDRRQTWGLTGNFVPVIERDLREEVPERTLADGSIHTPVDPDAVRAAAARLRDAGARALCIVFLHSYANPANERAALAAAREVWPNGDITISSDTTTSIGTRSGTRPSQRRRHRHTLNSRTRTRRSSTLTGERAIEQELTTCSVGAVCVYWPVFMIRAKIRAYLPTITNNNSDTILYLSMSINQSIWDSGPKYTHARRWKGAARPVQPVRCNAFIARAALATTA